MEPLFPTPQLPVFSYWEMTEHLSAIDLLIVGGGIVGLSTAIHSKNLAPKANVTILERGPMPSGASTKNAGFACFGSLSELLDDLEKQSQKEVFSRVENRIEGLRLLRSMLGDDAIGFEPCGGFELFMENNDCLIERCMDLISEANSLVRPFTGLKETYASRPELSVKMGLHGVKAVIGNMAEGSVDTGRMMTSLTNLARYKGVNIITGLGVKSLREKGMRTEVELDNGFTMQAGHVHVATNGFAKELLPNLDIVPARAQVLITSPIKGLQVQGTFHMDAGYYYFRNIGNRILLGGGRNLDIVGETTSEVGITDIIQRKLEQLLHEVILPDTPHTIAHRWSGVMGVGNTRDTLLKTISPNVSCGVRLGGMGVALGTLIGRQSAKMIFDKNQA